MAVLCRCYLPTWEIACPARWDAVSSQLAVLPCHIRTGLLISLMTQWAKLSWAQQAGQASSADRKYDTPGKHNTHFFNVVTKDTKATITSDISALRTSFRPELSTQHTAMQWLLITFSFFCSPGGKVKHQQDLIFHQAAILGLCAGC